MTTHCKVLLGVVATVLTLVSSEGLARAQAHNPPKPPPSLRLYIFDCGVIHTTNGDAYSLKKEEMASTEMSIPCILVAHPKGTLMWDNGDIPDRRFLPAEVRPPQASSRRTSRCCLRWLAAGYAPGDITYLSMSHYHGDHVANANSFAGATWLVRKVERDRMFATEPIVRSPLENYNELKNSKTILLDKDEWDVFGDGTVVIKSTPGHTPGHNVLFLKLKKTGPDRAERRSVSLPRGAHAQSPAGGGLQQGADRRVARRVGDLPQEDRRSALDRTRHHRQRPAEESAGVL